MQRLETNIAYLPTPYRCAIERLDGMADRTIEQLRDLCTLYAQTYGITADIYLHDYYTASACGIASRRFGLVQP